MSLHTRCLVRTAQKSPRRTAWRCTAVRCYASATANDPPWFQQLRSDMVKRETTSTREHIDVNVDHRLIDTICTFLPREWCPRPHGGRVLLPMGHHLVWFNTSLPADQLLPDGTDPLQSPGEPWVRRMWAGGSVRVRPADYYQAQTGFAVGSSMVCAERIQDVQLRGHGDAAKIFVTIDRRFARLETLQARHPAAVGDAGKQGPVWHFRQQLLSDDWGDAALREQRHLVFLKEKTPAELAAIRAGHMVPVRYLESHDKPDFSHTLTPTRALLFRYSALTFNAHLIHLDREYARNVEGHRNLLVHGPLSLTLMLQAMSGYIETKFKGQYVLESIEYRNLAPLYCDEKMRICGLEKKSLGNGRLYDVWIEGPTGGVAVRGLARTITVPAGGKTRALQDGTTSKGVETSEQEDQAAATLV